MGLGLINSFGMFGSIVQISFSKNQWSTEQWLALGGYRCQTTWVRTNLAKRLCPPNFTYFLLHHSQRVEHISTRMGIHTLCYSLSGKTGLWRRTFYSNVSLLFHMLNNSVLDEGVDGVNNYADWMETPWWNKMFQTVPQRCQTAKSGSRHFQMG